MVISSADFGPDPRLKPCPWCKKTDNLHFGAYLLSNDPDKWQGAIECTKCGAMGPVVKLDYDAAVEAWNMMGGEERQ